MFLFCQQTLFLLPNAILVHMLFKNKLIKIKLVSLVAVILFLQGFSAYAVIVSGKVTNQQGEPLAFANVYIKGTSNGTTTNIEGNYRLELPSGEQVLVFRYLGYKLYEQTINTAEATFVLDVKLLPENYSIAEIMIRPEGEDPAYAIIKNAIAKRKYYLNQVEAFTCNAYMKGIQKITKYPEKILGVDVKLGEIVDSKTGIAYLSESVSKLSYKKPGKIKETMISSKVSGNNRAFSFNQASDMEFNFYQNIIPAEGLSPRGFISPISGSALFYYRYRLEGTFFENGHLVNKIAVLPKRKGDPVFEGTIFIQDSTWRIHSTDLWLTKDAQIQFVDTLRVNQVYIAADKSDKVWLPGSVTFRFVFKFMGFEGDGNFVGVFSGYNITPAFERKHFKGSVMKINEDANKKDSVYWELMRPIPLTPEETVDYIRRDSLRVIKESKPYLDSLDKKSNRFKPGNLLTGYTYFDRYSKTEIQVGSLLETIQFNTVAGLVVGVGTSIEKKFENQRSVETSFDISHGFTAKKWNASGEIKYNYNIKKFGFFSISGGDDFIQYNEQEPIGPAINTYYSLFSGKNYMKLFRKQFGQIESAYEIFNGVRFSGGINYSVRSPLTNASRYAFSDSDRQNYTSNNPLNPYSDLPAFSRHEALKFNASLRLRIRQKYIDRPDFNIILGSRFPTLIINYEKGLSWSGSDVDFDRLEAGIEDEIRFGMLGKISYSAWYGNFLNTRKMFFIDYAHFLGNQTFFSGFETRRYDVLDYYSHSTNTEYLQAFVEHDFGGFILNKIPLLKKLKLNEIAGVRYLHVPGRNDHFEFSIGLEKLGLIRADYVIGLDEQGEMKSAFVIGVRGVLGR
jgi:hypothetical protein